MKTTLVASAIYILMFACSSLNQSLHSLVNGKVTLLLPESYTRLSTEEIEQSFKDSSPYILASNPEVFGSAERSVLISIFETPFSLWEDGLEDYKRTIEMMFQTMEGARNVKAELIKIKQRKWIHLSVDKSGNQPVHNDIFLTPLNGNTLNVIFMTKEPVNKQNKGIMRKVIGSIDLRQGRS